MSTWMMKKRKERLLTMSWIRRLEFVMQTQDQDSGMDTF
jgi:hypothetical protein